jgi:putative hemolysin
MKSKLITALIVLCLISFACSLEKDNSLAESQTILAKRLANPAAVKCVKDGYELEPIEENGISRGYFCVNKETGIKCEVWSYFRGECDLTIP